MPGPNAQALDEYLARFMEPGRIEAVARGVNMPQEEVARFLKTYIEEARYGYGLVAPHLPKNGKILEVGSGLGILTGFLRLQGFGVVSLEPAATGFGMFEQMQLALRKEAGLTPATLTIGAEALTPAHGKFDFIFSVNVLEHIAELPKAVAAMAAVLAEGGRMLHSCPNYFVPYEPHFSVPLVPFCPGLTRYILPGRIVQTDLWKSVNFVTYFQLRRMLEANGCAASFRKGIMAEQLKRLDSDPVFAARHGTLIPMIYRVMKVTGLMKLLEVMSPAFGTPMIVDVRK